MRPGMVSRGVPSDEARASCLTLSCSQSASVTWVRSIKYSEDLKLEVLPDVLYGQ